MYCKFVIYGFMYSYRYMYSYITLRTELVNKPHTKLSITPIYYQNYPALLNSLNKLMILYFYHFVLQIPSC